MDKIVRISDDYYIIVFHNRPPVVIRHDAKEALALVEYVLSPRNDLSYSDYLRLSKNEKTDPNYKVPA